MQLNILRMYQVVHLHSIKKFMKRMGDPYEFYFIEMKQIFSFEWQRRYFETLLIFPDRNYNMRKFDFDLVELIL